MHNISPSATGDMRLYGLIGYPLTHSFSKKYFTEKFAREGITDCRFENFELSHINELPMLLENHPDMHGLAVTIPYKQQILHYLDTSLVPDGLHACNCIRIVDKKLIGYNTDHSGFAKSLQPLLQSHHKKALILGNGGATAAVAFALQEIGIGFSIVSRALHNNSSLTYADLDENTMASHTLIINTTPLGMYPAIVNCPPIPYNLIGPDHLLYDLIYNPEMTLFLEKAAERGAVIKNGEEMLMLQAEENWNIWNEA